MNMYDIFHYSICYTRHNHAHVWDFIICLKIVKIFGNVQGFALSPTIFPQLRWDREQIAILQAYNTYL
jgi:hypothetical protein